MSVRRSVLASTVISAGWLLGLPGCIGTNFVQTDRSHVPHDVGSLPETYVDRLPPRHYHSVGIIEVTAATATGLNVILAAAAKKGKEVGCDVVVDRSIHHIEGREQSPLRRWRVALATPLRRPVAAPLATPRARLKPSSALLAWVSRGIQPTYVQPTYVVTPPPQIREFICGVYDDTSPSVAPVASVMPGEGGPDVGLGRLLWRAVASGARDEKTCGKVYALLTRDKECKGEQCHAPFALSEELLARCEGNELGHTDLVELWRARWEGESKGTGTPACVRALKNAARSAEAAQHLGDICLKDRPPSQVEQAIVRKSAAEE
jgi:hypothetical protein